MTQRPAHDLNMREQPRVVLSLDLEMCWGVHDIYGVNLDGQRAELEQDHQVVPALLRLLAAHGIKATWATVGALGCQGWNDYFECAPLPPQYANSALQVKRVYADADPEGELHFAPHLIRQILDTPGQELGTHTFSHLYLRERGITADDVAADLAAVTRLHEERFGMKPLSLVFPRNQTAFVDVVREAGIRMWRGNPQAWWYECEDTAHNGPLPRALKLIDGINPFCRLASPVIGDMTRATMFLRLNLPRYLWTVHLQRIKRELAAARVDDVFHIWFHPHNCGRDTAARLARVEQVVEVVAEKQRRGELRSCAMQDLID